MIRRERRGSLAALLLLLATATELAAADRRPRLLLTNDDGIAAPGLAALYVELARLGEVTVAAPAENQSGVGHGITYAEPIFVRTISPLVKMEGSHGRWYRIAARPATCVRLALAALLPEPPDLVVSGINAGENPGLALHVSGTVAAAREAAFDGIPALAVALAEGEPMDWARAAKAAAEIAGQVLARGLPAGTFLSVNVPSGAIRGVRVVPHAARTGTRTYERRASPYGQEYYWSLWAEPADPSLASDVGALAQGFVTVTPLRVEANDPAALAVLSSWRLEVASGGAPPP